MMLPDDVLHDLRTSAMKGLRRARFIGINDQNFHAASPDLPFGDDEVRSAAVFMRQQGIPARAVRFQFEDVVNHVLVVARTEDDLQRGQMNLSEGITKTAGATFTVLDLN